MNNRRQNRWSRIFVLLIFVMMAALAADRIVGQYGPITFRSPTSEANGAVTDQGTATPTEMLLPAAEDYVFLPPTEMPVTPTPSPTATITPTPTLNPVVVRNEVLTTLSPGGGFVRPTPLAGAGRVIAKCDLPDKQYQYALYNLAGAQFRSLTASLDYLDTDLSQTERAFEDGFIQAGLPENFLNSFALPDEWLRDRLFSVISVSADAHAILIERYGQGRGVYWITFEDDSPTLLLRLAGSIEEIVVGQEHSVVFIEVIEQGLHNLYFIRLNSGEIIPATPFQPLNATHGRISSDGGQLAYETSEGVWVVNLDGSFGSLAVPAGAAPEWAPRENELLVLMDGNLHRSKLDGKAPQPVYDLSGRMLQVESAEWQTDAQHLILWKISNGNCAWVQYDLATQSEKELYRFPQGQCRSTAPFQFSPDGNWLIGTVPGGMSRDLNAFDVLCDLTGNKGCFSLQMASGTNFCQHTTWTDYSPDFEWTFDANEEGWGIIQQLHSVRSVDGMWKGISLGSYPVMASPIALAIDADQYLTLEIVMRVSNGKQAMVYFATRSDPTIDDKKAFPIPLEQDGEFHRYVLDLSAVENWSGVVNRIRIRPSDVQNAEIAIDSIRISTGVDR